jgi:hypothetical protein
MIVTCPSCRTQFEPEAAIAQAIKDEYNQKWTELSRKKDEQFAERERQKEEQYQKEKQVLVQQQQQQEKLMQQQQAELAKKLDEEKKAMELALRKELGEKVGADYEHKMRLLEDANRANEARLKESREKEVEYLRKEQELISQKQQMELEVERKLLEGRAKLAEVIKKDEEEKNKLRETEFQLKLKEKDKQLEDQRKLVEEMKRKSEQGSMQLQGEVQELELENLLRYAFPFDVVNEVGKGVRGADCVLTVRDKVGRECGKIIFESKRTKDFSEDWIEKLKADMRGLNGDIGVIVTQAMPRDMPAFGERNGIWVCTFGEVRPLVHVLRELVIKVYTATKSQENKGDKMTMLYNYFVGAEFSEQWKAIREGFVGMKMSIQRERDQMEKLWKAREKQLEKILLNAAHFKGTIEGIAGMEVDLNLLPEDENLLLE